jgi:hypothetical protein
MTQRRQRSQRRQPGGAVISVRQPWLRAQLADLGVGVRFLPLQGARRGELLPALRPPLLLDTAELDPALLAAILAELHRARPALPTVALIAPNDALAQRLVPLCGMIYAVVVDTQLALVPPLLRQVGLVGQQRGPQARLATLGFLPPAVTVTDADLLSILAELPAARALSEVAQATHLSLPTVHRKLKAARAALGIARPPGQKRPTPPELAVEFIAALRQPPRAASAPVARARGHA